MTDDAGYSTICGICYQELTPTRPGPGGGDLFEKHECPPEVLAELAAEWHPEVFDE